MTNSQTSNRIVAIIPARGGSKGILRKNVRVVGGLPLIAHSILDGRDSVRVTEVYVSTDDAEIAEVSRSHGARVIERPADISGDTASSETALIHALDVIEQDGPVDLVVFLQCTSPVRSGADIDAAIATLEREQADSLLSVSPSHRFLWKQGPQGPVALNYDPMKRPRRQELEPQYMENGSIYLFRPWVLRRFANRLGGKIALSVMSPRAAFEIDDELDLAVIGFLLSNTTDSLD
ncbi:CMP-N-acetylneuraminic acid synthetase [Candidatus Terasakiella magnetica]|nr:CMP-N-acetylneuraminic acid synthetase [Candidatus Terasakiella magnetica]